MDDETVMLVDEIIEISDFVNVLKGMEKSKEDIMFWVTSEILIKSVLDGVEEDQQNYIIVAIQLAITASRNFMQGYEEEYEEEKSLLSMVITEPDALIKYYIFNYDRIMSSLRVAA